MIIGVAGIRQRRLAVALQKISLERLGIFHGQQHRGERHLAVERDRLAAEFAFGGVGHLFQFDLRERLAGDDLSRGLHIQR